MKDKYFKIILIGLLLRSLSAIAETDSNVYLIGNVEEIRSLDIPSEEVELPNIGSVYNYKISDYVLNSNLPHVIIRYSCESSPNDNSSCFLMHENSNLYEDRVNYSLSLDQSEFYGVITHNGEIRISYNIQENKIAGLYSDKVTLTVSSD